MLTRNLSFTEPFPGDILLEIRGYPGNDRCCDCASLDTDWCSISHGTLICLECAGKHRSLGVLVSFVRSIPMDSWSRQQVEMIRQGGNEQIKRFFRKLEIENYPLQSLYCSKGANHYREKLKEKVDKIMSGEIKSEPRHVRTHHHPSHRNAKSQSSLSELMRNKPNSALAKQQQQPLKPSIEIYTISFHDGPMGMTISKDFNSRALVSRLVPNGPAELNGVCVGDHITGIAKKRIDNYDEIMHMIPCMSRPILIQFTRQIHNHHSSSNSSNGTSSEVLSGSVDNSVTASPGRNRSLHGSKSMANLSLNMVVINSSYSKPKLRSPRLGIVQETSEDETSELGSVCGSLRSPTGSNKLVSYRTKSKDSTESTTPKFDFKGTLENSTSSYDNSYNSRNLGESSLVDDRKTPADSPHPLTMDTPPPDMHSSFWSVDSFNSSSCVSENAVQNPSTHSTTEEYVGIATTYTGTDSTSGNIDHSVIPHSVELYKQIDKLLVRSGEKLQLEAVSDTSAGDINTTQLTVESSEENSPEARVLGQQHALVASENIEKKQLILHTGTPLKVLRNERWRSASMHRLHRDGSFKVAYRDGSTESRVSIERIAMTVDTLRALADWQACTTAISPTTTATTGVEEETAAEKEMTEAFRAASVEHQDSDVEHFSSPDSSYYTQHSVGSSQVHSFRADDLPSTDQFVVEGADELNNWIESEAVPCCENIERERLSSFDSVLSDGIGYSSCCDSSDGFTYLEAVYDQAPLGLRITNSASRSASGANSPMVNAQNIERSNSRGSFVRLPPEVTKVVSGGRSDVQGVRVGDVLVLVEGQSVRDYADAMAVLQTSSYPLRLQFRRVSTTVRSTVPKGAIVLMNSLLDKMGLQKNVPPLAQSPPLMKRTASKRMAVPVIPEGILDCESMENSPHRPAWQMEDLECVTSTCINSTGKATSANKIPPSSSSVVAAPTVGSRVPIAMIASIGEFPVQDDVTNTNIGTTTTVVSTVAEEDYQDVVVKPSKAVQSRT